VFDRRAAAGRGGEARGLDGGEGGRVEARVERADDLRVPDRAVGGDSELDADLALDRGCPRGLGVLRLRQLERLRLDELLAAAVVGALRLGLERALLGLDLLARLAAAGRAAGVTCRNGQAAGAACVIEAEQLCLLLGEDRRGDERVVTQAFSGAFTASEQLRNEFLRAIG
jgi:hypothetical protein